MRNLAGHPNPDDICAAELAEAGIPVERLPQCMRESRGEVKSIVIGSLHGWSFVRYWYYWVAKGPGIPPVYANRLHETHGQQCRVAGHCGCPSPLEWYKGFAVPDYHVDTADGLKALAGTIKLVVEEAARSAKENTDV